MRPVQKNVPEFFGSNLRETTAQGVWMVQRTTKTPDRGYSPGRRRLNFSRITA